MEGTIGEIRMFAGNFAPRNWEFCDGQLLSVNENQALFSILGTTYGGDGRTTFALPDLRGRVPMGEGDGPGLSNVRLGQHLGEERVTMQTNEMPAHNHAVSASAKANPANGNEHEPTGNYWADPSNNVRIYNTAHDTTMAADAVEITEQNQGGGRAHENRQPSLGMNFVICTQGIYPSRS